MIEALKKIELNTTEICNRTCSFCPRGNPEVYGNSKNHMSLDTVKKIADDLNDINYSELISFVGFGEPFLYKHLFESISIFRKKLPNINCLRVITNGDFLYKNKIKTLYEAGCNSLVISMYDKDISQDVLKLIPSNIKMEIIFKHAYSDKFEIKLVNRTDIMLGKEININRPCFLPYYKMFFDWNGDVIVCSNDWGRQGKVGNVLQNSIENIWNNQLYSEYRKHLMYGRRSDLTPCKFCNIDGTIEGEDSVTAFRNAI
jgi:radical SAM protein with 4Fe4S-binding SPASM domain